MRWYATTLPFLEGETLITMREYQPYPLKVCTVGELPKWMASRDYNGQWTMPAALNGKHICHREWFRTGEPWPTSLPDTEYDSFWIPTCCDAVSPVGHTIGGGVEFGGAVLHAVAYYHSPGGGFSIGGAVVHNVAMVHATGRGFAIGGAVVHELAHTHAPGGGFAIGGPVVHNDNFLHAPGGGVSIGGGVEHAVATPHTAGGGVEVGGGVVHEYGFSIAPGKGFAIGGGVPHAVAFVRAVGKGFALGGGVLQALRMVHAPGKGFALGGALGHDLRFGHTAGGGLSIGGAVSHTFTPPSITPGSSCAGAGAIAPGQSYSGNTPTGFFAADWFVFSVVSGTHYTVTMSGVGAGGTACAVGTGSCPLPTPVTGSPLSGIGTIGFTAGATGSAFISVSSTMSPTAYTVALSSP